MEVSITVSRDGRSYTIKPLPLSPIYRPDAQIQMATYMLTNEDGEGMEISDIELFELLDEYFRENF